MSAPVRCNDCGAIVPRRDAYQTFVCLDSCAPGGTRQRSKAGRHLEEYWCHACAEKETLRVRQGAAPQDSLL